MLCGFLSQLRYLTTSRQVAYYTEGMRRSCAPSRSGRKTSHNMEVVQCERWANSQPQRVSGTLGFLFCTVPCTVHHECSQDPTGWRCGREKRVRRSRNWAPCPFPSSFPPSG